jgi:glycosyltransferase involved in cell wall biosynthesis
VLKFISGKPSLATAHGTVRGLLNLTGDVVPFASHAYSSLFTESLERSGFSSAQKVAAVSHSCMEELMDYYEIPGDKIKVVHNGLDMRKIHRVNTRIREKFECDHLLFFIGRLAKQKGVEYLIQALPMLEEYDIKLVIAGTGPEETHLRQLVSELKLKKRVEFAGAVDERKKLELMSASDALVCPSLWESFGMILLEAMACRLPVVATRVASIPEVVGDCGVLVEPRNPKELSDGMRKLLDDKKAAKKLARKAYVRLTENFTVERMADGYIRLYKELIS